MHAQTAHHPAPVQSGRGVPSEVPTGRPDNSPAFQRRGTRSGRISPEGTADRPQGPSAALGYNAPQNNSLLPIGLGEGPGVRAPKPQRGYLFIETYENRIMFFCFSAA